MGEVRAMKAQMLRRWERYFAARNNGRTPEKAALAAKISESTAYRFERGDPTSSGLEAAKMLGITSVGGSVVGEPISHEAQKALEDFAYFRLRYFGRISTPWQTRAAYDVLRALESNQREFIVINCPPGSGKSTLFTHDIICWLVARNRAIRIQIGSRTERQARMYVARIKKSLEREIPMRAGADDLADGVSFDAQACMQDDFGAFKPEGRTDLWRAEGLVVRQLDGVALDDKEPTVTAWGQDSGFLGLRVDLVLWDDLVDRKNTRGEDAKTITREWWGTEAETRLEPKGVLILQGQRIAHDDLYKFCLDMKGLDDLPKYRHIIYKAHDEERCKQDHDLDAERAASPWPDGCLLDPRRLSMRFLETIKHNDPRVYQVQYQQEDGDVAGGLVDPAWITGGVDSDGYPAPGCLDKDRTSYHIPAHLTSGRGWSFVTVDPSPTEWWGVIWWVYDPVSENRYIVDIIRRRMNPEQFLTMDLDSLAWSGVMHDLRAEALRLQAPISHVIFEQNAAQRWFLTQPIVQRWMDQTGILFVPHTTHLNKADPKFGLESIGDLFRQGRIRIPHSTVQDRTKAHDLISEALHYPDSDTTDLLMSTWFGKLGVENHYTLNRMSSHRLPVPEWLERSQRGLAGVGRGMPSWR